MLRFQAIAIGFALLMTGLPARAAFVIIDNFTSPAVATVSLIGPGPNPAVMVGPTGLGATRTSTFTVNAPLPANNFDLIAQQGAGRLDFNSGTFSSAQANLFYNNFTGGTNNFFANGTPFQFLLSFVNIDPGINLATGSPALDMPVDIAIATSAGTLSGSFFLSSSAVPVVYSVPFSALTGFGDLADVISVNLTFNGGPNQRQRTDFVLDGIRFETIVAPAPPAAFMALAGVPLFALVRRLRRS